MSSQFHKKTLKQMEKTEFLVASARTWKPTVNARRAGAGSPGTRSGSPGEPDWDHVQEWCIDELETSAESLRRADRHHREQRVFLQQARLDRDLRLAGLESGQRALRRSFSGTYGPESLALFGLDAEPARALVAAREQIRGIVVLLRDPQMAAGLPAPKAGQAPIPLTPLADFWDGEITALEARMLEIDQLRKKAQEAMIARDQALKQSRRAYANAGRILEGLYRFAGLDQLADRIRLTERSPRKSQPNEESPVMESEEDGDAAGSLDAADVDRNESSNGGC